ncbi:MAG: hypothetical protein ABFD45_09970 [Smithella sp.]|jgi:hypothetical protein
MNTVKKMYAEIPETIDIPKEFIHKKGEVIIILDDVGGKKPLLKDFHGSIPDFPERTSQGDFEERTPL